MMRRFRLAAATCGGLLAWVPASAASAPAIFLDAETDHRERGLSASGGKAALGVSASVPVTYDLSLDLDAVSLRGSARHGGADFGVTIAPRYDVRSGGWELGAGARGHVFVGRAGLAYGEVTAEVGRTLGPARLVVGAAFAPAQDAIGGSNLYLDAQLSASIPGTPLTLYGGLGHTSGAANGDPRAARLRPGGAYLDHHLGAEYARGKVAAGIRYSGTSIGAGEVDRLSPWTDRHHGARVLAYLRVTP